MVYNYKNNTSGYLEHPKLFGMRPQKKKLARILQKDKQKNKYKKNIQNLLHRLYLKSMKQNLPWIMSLITSTAAVGTTQNRQ